MKVHELFYPTVGIFIDSPNDIYYVSQLLSVKIISLILGYTE
jgi:hypothetical protein